MKLADYVIVGVILIWFCAAVRIIIRNRGGCGCGAGGSCSGCDACKANGKGCSGCRHGQPRRGRDRGGAKRVD